jgi:hypothetical protein
MERALDFDFGRVRVHEGLLPSAFGADAVAAGWDIWFAPGCYRPGQAAGRRLLAHELVHVVQQQAGRVTNPFADGAALLHDPVLEAEAETWAARIVGESGDDRSAVDGAAGTPVAVALPSAWASGVPRVFQCAGQPPYGSALPNLLDEDEVVGHNWGSVPSRHRDAKRFATGGMNVGSIGLQAASIATGSSSIAVAAAIATGAAVSATGVGLVAAGGALALGSLVLNARSAHKTRHHIDHLKKIQGNLGSFQWCVLLSSDPRFANLHGTVGNIILPYIINQKKEKFGKKVAGAAGAGLLTNLYAAGRYAYKGLRGRLGKKRHLYAEYLAVHLITADCELAKAIVAELYSKEELKGLMAMDSSKLAPLLADKMKSL